MFRSPKSPKTGKRCKCGKSFTIKSSYNRHLDTCTFVATASAETARLAAETVEQGSSKRLRVHAPVCFLLFLMLCRADRTPGH